MYPCTYGYQAEIYHQHIYGWACYLLNLVDAAIDELMGLYSSIQANPTVMLFWIFLLRSFTRLPRSLSTTQLGEHASDTTYQRHMAKHAQRNMISSDGPPLLSLAHDSKVRVESIQIGR